MVGQKEKRCGGVGLTWVQPTFAADPLWPSGVSVSTRRCGSHQENESSQGASPRCPQARRPCPRPSVRASKCRFASSALPHFSLCPLIAHSSTCPEMPMKPKCITRNNYVCLCSSLPFLVAFSGNEIEHFIPLSRGTKDIRFCLHVALTWFLHFLNSPWWGEKVMGCGNGAPIPDWEVRLIPWSHCPWGCGPYLYGSITVCLVYLCQSSSPQCLFLQSSTCVSYVTFTISTCASAPLGGTDQPAQQVKGRGALCWGAHEEAAERRHSLFPLKRCTWQLFGCEKHNTLMEENFKTH